MYDLIDDHWYLPAERVISPHCSPRDDPNAISLLVIHNISLPEGEFGAPYIDDLFMGVLDCKKEPSFHDLEGVCVSAHILIRRTGKVTQYVPFDQKAWHAGVSKWQSKEDCNQFSIGIEMEGADIIPYTEEQYAALVTLTISLLKKYPQISIENIVGHCDIAPGRKTDPGIAFAWMYYQHALSQAMIS